MSYIQLIERTVLPTSLWLTFWDLNDESQLSLEIAGAIEPYEVGRVFRLDRDAKFERLALRPVVDVAEMNGLTLLIPAPSGKPRPDRMVRQMSVTIRETSAGVPSDHDGLLSVLC